MKADDSMEKVANNYLSIVNLTGEIIVRVDKEGRCTFLNDSACKFWGKARKKLLGIKFVDYLHPDDVKKTTAVVKKIIKTKKTLRGLINRQKTPKGWRIVEWNAALIFGKVGNPVGLQATGRDITEFKNTEEKLIQMRTALKSAKTGFVIINADREFVFINKAFLKNLNCSRARLCGTKIADHLSKESACLLSAWFKTKQPIKLSKRIDFIDCDGEKVGAETRGTLVMNDSNNTILGAIIVLENVLRKKYKISDVAKKLGYEKTTIIRLEKRGLIPFAKRDEHGWRYYSQKEFDNVVKKVTALKMGKKKLAN